MNYSEFQRMQIAQQEYNNTIKVGKEVTIDKNKTTIGTVVDVIDQSDNGLHMTVIRSQIFILPYKISNSACFIV